MIIYMSIVDKHTDDQTGVLVEVPVAATHDHFDIVAVAVPQLEYAKCAPHLGKPLDAKALIAVFGPIVNGYGEDIDADRQVINGNGQETETEGSDEWPVQQM